MINKKLTAKIVLGLMLATPYTAFADSFTDGFTVVKELEQGDSHYKGTMAPTTDTTIDKDITYSLTLNKGSATTNTGVSTLYVNQNGKTFTYNGKTNVYLSTNLTGTGNNSANALCLYAGNVVFNDDAEFTTIVKGENGKSAYGIGAVGGGNDVLTLNFNGDSVKVNVTTDVARQENGTYCEAAGISAYAADIVASANTKTEITVTGTSTSEKATPVYGILNEAGNVDLQGDTVITVTTNGYGTDVKSGKDAAGLAVGVKVIDGFYNSTMGNRNGRADTTLNNAVVNVVNNAVGGKAIGMEAVNFVDGNADEAVLTVDGNLDLTATADTARGVIAQDGKKVVLGSENSDYINVTAKSVNSENDANINAGILALKSGTVDVNTKTLNVTTNATGDGWAYGISAQNNTTDATDNMASINISADNIYVNSTADTEGHAAGFVTMSQGQMNVHGNVEVHADNAIVTRGDSAMNINMDEADVNNTTKLYGDINFSYDEKTSGTKVDADVNINLNGEDSVWEGNTVMDWALKEGGNTSFDDIKDKLSVDGCNIILANGAQWNATQVPTTGTEGKAGSAYIALNNLTLNDGVVNLDKMEGQTLEIEKLTGEGGTVNTNSLDNKMSIGTVVGSTSVTVNGSGEIADAIYGGDATAQDLADVVTTGTGESEKSAASQITTDEGIIAGKITADVKDGEVTNYTVAKNTTNVGLSNLAAINLMTWRQENNDMNKRLGELRDSKGEHGVWARMVRGEVEYESIQNQYNYYQVGYDEKLSTDPNWTVGMFLTRTEGNSTFRTGSAENNHTGVGVYGSYLKDDGSFIDLVAKYARIDSDFNANGGVGSGDYNTNGYSISAEYGKRFEQGNGFWIEPQVELTYGTVGAVDYTTSNGAKVRQEGMDSLVGRVGFSLGKDIKAGNIYARASYLYDFDGETEVTMSHSGISDVYEQDLGGGWFEVGVGTNINLSDATHLYFDVEKTYGGDVATPWQWSAGIRYSF